ncbi:MAG: HAD family hydrolase, partial [Spirochaetes bacterium]|nr:HAD family hydrolase [Spirochaetota bacterium]
VPDETEQKRLLERKLRIFEKNRIEIFPQVREILQFLKSKNVLLALVTGSLKRSVGFILPGDIFQFFNAVVTFDDITKGKPHPEPYLKALEMTGCRPGDALVIENAPFGIESAKKAGIDCLALETTLPEAYLNGADLVFKNHEALFAHLKNIFN